MELLHLRREPCNFDCYVAVGGTGATGCANQSVVVDSWFVVKRKSKHQIRRVLVVITSIPIMMHAAEQPTSTFSLTTFALLIIPGLLGKRWF